MKLMTFFFAFTSLFLTGPAWSKGKVEITSAAFLSERVMTCAEEAKEKVTKVDNKKTFEIGLGLKRSRWSSITKIVIEDKANKDKYLILPINKKSNDNTGWYEYQRDKKRNNGLHTYFPLRDPGRDIILNFPANRFRLKKKQTKIMVKAFAGSDVIFESDWVDANFGVSVASRNIPKFEVKNNGKDIDIKIGKKSDPLNIFVEWGDDPHSSLTTKEFSTKSDGREINVETAGAKYFTVIVENSGKNASRSYMEAVDTELGCARLNKDPHEGNYSVKANIWPGQNPKEIAAKMKRRARYQRARKKLKKK